MTGVLWVRDCKITNAGAHVALDIKGNGWLWVDKTKRKGGGTFAVRQYVRFGIDTTIRGVLDLGYDHDTHVASLWLTPDRAPAVKFTTLGEINVDAEGAWSSFVRALGKTFASSPQDLAEIQVTSPGTHALEAELATGFAVTLDLCTGLSRFHLRRPPKGRMGNAGVGDTLRVPVEVQPGGVIIIGPQLASHGMTIQADAEKGGVRLALVCAEQAEKVAAEFMAGRITSRMPVLGHLPPCPCTRGFASRARLASQGPSHRASSRFPHTSRCRTDTSCTACGSSVSYARPNATGSVRTIAGSAGTSITVRRPPPVRCKTTSANA